METNEIIEGNKLIAEFMGLKIDGNICICSEDIKSNNEWYMHNYNISMAKYHKSWDWLMPVVDSIESLNFLFGVVNNSVWIKDLNKTGRDSLDDTIIEFYPSPDLHETKIYQTYKAVVSFIKWYNKNYDTKAKSVLSDKDIKK